MYVMHGMISTYWLQGKAKGKARPGQARPGKAQVISSLAIDLIFLISFFFIYQQRSCLNEANNPIS
jgi:hypothetical protein